MASTLYILSSFPFLHFQQFSSHRVKTNPPGWTCQTFCHLAPACLWKPHLHCSQYPKHHLLYSYSLYALSFLVSASHMLFPLLKSPSSLCPHNPQPPRKTSSIFFRFSLNFSGRTSLTCRLSYSPSDSDKCLPSSHHSL